MTVEHTECLFCRTQMRVFRSLDFRDLLCVSCMDTAQQQVLDLEADEISTWIGESLEQQGILVYQMKEKYGDPRVYCHLYRDTLWWPLSSLFHWHAVRTYSRIYHEALTRWPHRRESILRGADYRELLHGGT